MIFQLAYWCAYLRKELVNFCSSYHWKISLQDKIIFRYLKIILYLLKTEKHWPKTSVDKVAAMHATRKGAAATWIKEAVPEWQFILRYIQRNISSQ